MNVHVPLLPRFANVNKILHVSSNDSVHFTSRKTESTRTEIWKSYFDKSTVEETDQARNEVSTVRLSFQRVL